MKKSLFIFALLMNFQTDVLSDENNHLFKQEKILPANEVFVISTKNENNKIYVEWRIRENYYLYFDSIKIQNKKEPIRYKILESSVYETEDEYFGKTKIYKDYLKIVFNDNYDESDHAIFYQGCAEQGFCYPIQKYIL